MSLFDAVVKNDYDLVKKLIENKVNINDTNEDEETPLMVASQYGNFEISKLLISNGADVNLTDKYKQTPLHWASLKGHLRICELLISSGADVNYVDEYERTPLHLAAENNHFLVCKLLIRSGANINHINIDNEKPIDLAIDNKIIKLLIENGADKQIDITDKNVLENFVYTKAPDIGIKKNLEYFDLSFPSPVIDEKSPRAIYDKLTHSGQITMLGSEFGQLFKIRIEHPDLYELFENYKNLSENPKIDCAFQVLFSLGLRDIKSSKRNSKVINKLGKYKKAIGVNVDDLNEYLEQIFGLRKNSLLSTYYDRFNCNYFNVNLSDGLATILFLNFDTDAHYVIVFKSGGMLFIFDPQKPIIFECQEIEDYYPKISGFRVIHLNPDVTIEDKPLLIEKCSLPMFALGRKPKKTKSRKSRKSKKSKKSKTKKRRPPSLIQ